MRAGSAVLHRRARRARRRRPRAAARHRGRRCARQPCSSTTVLCGSTISAGPVPAPRAARPSARSGTSRQPPNQALHARRQRRRAGARGAAVTSVRRIDRGRARLDAQRLDDHRERVRPRSRSARRCSAWKRARTPSSVASGTDRVHRCRRRAARAAARRAAARAHRRRRASSARACCSSRSSAPLRRRQPRRVERAGAGSRAAPPRRSATPMPKADSTLASGCTQHAAHAGGARHAAGVLAGRAAEAEQREIRRHRAPGAWTPGGWHWPSTRRRPRGTTRRPSPALQPPATCAATRAVERRELLRHHLRVDADVAPSRPNTRGSVSARRCPSSTCTSVRVSGPPRP